MSEANLNKIVHMISDLEVPIDVCRIFENKNVANLQLNKKDSASDSEVLFATYMKSSDVDLPYFDVAMKIWVPYDELTDTQIKLYEKIGKEYEDKKLIEKLDSLLATKDFLKGLKYEAEVYNYVTEKIVKPNLSPNFIPLLGYGSCSLYDIFSTLMSKFNYSKDQLIDYFSPTIFFPAFNPELKTGVDLKLNIMITGTLRGQVGSLKDLLEKDAKSNILSVNDRAAIIFQCLHALLLLEHFRIMHYDLHMGNVLVENLKEPICLKFNVNGNQVSFTTSYIPKFFDWDRGYVEDIGVNIALNSWFTLDKHDLQKFILNRDYYQFICSMHDFPKFWDIVKQILPVPDYENWKYNTIEDATEGIPEVYINISKETSAKLLKYIRLNSNNVTLDKEYGNKYIEFPKKDFYEVFTKTEIEDMKIPPKRQEYSDVFYIRYGKDFSRGIETNTVFINPGWVCQALFNPSSDLLHPLVDVFSNIGIFSKLTSGLIHCDNKDPANEFYFTTSSARKRKSTPKLSPKSTPRRLKNF